LTSINIRRRRLHQAFAPRLAGCFKLSQALRQTSSDPLFIAKPESVLQTDRRS